MEFVINHLAKQYGEKKVLVDCSFRFQEGKIYALLGRNGSGKTTLFNCINHDIPYDGGDCYLVDDQGVQRPLKQSDIGYVLSTPTVPEFLTGREFLKFFMDINKDKRGGRGFLAPDRYFDQMLIAPDDRDRLMKDYSHGMKNKMQMLINVIAEPDLMLLDEPLTSLDVVAAEEMKTQLRHMKEGRITIFSTHILDLALDLCDSIVLLSHGMLEEIDRTALDDEELKNRIIQALRSEDGMPADDSRLHGSRFRPYGGDVPEGSGQPRPYGGDVPHGSGQPWPYGGDVPEGSGQPRDNDMPGGKDHAGGGGGLC